MLYSLSFRDKKTRTIKKQKQNVRLESLYVFISIYVNLYAVANANL